MRRLGVESDLDIGNELPNPDVAEVLIQGKSKQVVLMRSGW